MNVEQSRWLSYLILDESQKKLKKNSWPKINEMEKKGYIVYVT